MKSLQLQKRKNIRLKDYNYGSQGAYFITICIKERHNLLWENVVGASCARPCLHSSDIPLSNIGKIVEKEINKIESFYNNVVIDKYVVMPNHIHLIIIINDTESGRPKVAPTTISRIIQQFKGSITKQIGFSMWQKLFHDHIIRNEAEYIKILKYIEENPLNWKSDCYYK